ncbi:MAG: TolC family protein [Bacteroidia bacterium]
MLFKKISLALIAVAIFTHTEAQKKWSLKECVDYALENNLQIKQTGINTDITRVNYNQSFAAFFPSINGSANQSFNYGRSVDPTTNVYSNQNINGLQGSISADVTIFNGLLLQNTLKQYKLDYAAGKYDIDKAKNDIAMSAVADYLSVLYAQENLKLANDRVDITTKQRNNIKLQVDAGNLAQGNLLDIESQVALEELGVVNAENTLRQAFLSLTQVMNLDSAEGFAIDPPIVTLPDQSVLALTPEAIYATSQGIMPEIKSSELKFQSSEKSISIARASYYPRLSAFGQLSSNYSNQSKQLDGPPVITGYSFSGQVTASGEEVLSPDYKINYKYTSFSDQVNNNFNKAFGFGLTIPIFNSLNAKSNVDRAKLTMKYAGFTLDLQKQLLYKSIQQAHIDALNSSKKYQAATKSVDALKTSFSYTEKKFNVGMINTVDYTTTKNNLAKAESDLLQAKYELIFRIKVLDFYMGKPLM